MNVDDSNNHSDSNRKKISKGYKDRKKDRGEVDLRKVNPKSFSNALPVTLGIAALAKAQQRPLAFAPANSADKVNELSNAAQALDYELGMGMSVSPSPFGTVKSDDAGPRVTREEITKNPNDNPVTTYYGDGTKEIVLKANYGHSYFVKGRINGKEVTFLVDTGASDVNIPWRLANLLGLDKNKGRSSKARTANGLVEVYETLIDSLQIGDIELKYVRGSVNQGDTSEEILLGMSALKKLEFAYTDEKLYLRQRPG